MSKIGIFFLLSCSILMADVRYTLRCEIESTDKKLMESGALKEAARDCSSEIFQTAARQMSRTSQLTQIVEYANENTILIDHVKKTWTRNSAAQAAGLAQTAMEQMKQMGAKVNMTTEAIKEKREIAGYEAKGLTNLLEISFAMPGIQEGMSSAVRIEFWVSETAPGAKEILAWAAKQKDQGVGSQASLTMRMLGQIVSSIPGGNQMLQEGGNLFGQLMEVSMKMESKGMGNEARMNMVMRAEKFLTDSIPASEFEIPDGYKEVK